jgi:hypothetical protein
LILEALTDQPPNNERLIFKPSTYSRNLEPRGKTEIKQISQLLYYHISVHLDVPDIYVSLANLKKNTNYVCESLANAVVAPNDGVHYEGKK